MMPLPPTQSFHVIFCQALARFRTKPCERLLAQGKCDFQERDPRRDGPGRFDHPNLPMITPIYLRLVGFYCNYLNWVHFFKGKCNFTLGTISHFFFEIQLFGLHPPQQLEDYMSQRKCIHSFRQHLRAAKNFSVHLRLSSLMRNILRGFPKGPHLALSDRFGTASSPWSTPGSRYLCTSPQPTRHVFARKPGLYLDISVMR